jgi:hypothetical protein
MSIVSNFVAAMHAQAAPMIGQEAVTIGNDSILCTLAEASDGSEFGNGGFDAQKSLTAVCLTSALPSGVILKKAATARGETWRIDNVSKGATFTTLTLGQVSKS